MKRPQIFKLASGFRGKAKNCYRIAKPKVQKALLYAYRDRRVKKRTLRSSFITQINAATRLHGLAYSQFQHGLVLNHIQLNRKVLSDLAVNEPYSFQSLIHQVKTTIPTRNTASKQISLMPQKLKLSPVDWETFKKEVHLHDQLEDHFSGSNEYAHLTQFFTVPVAQAKLQNINDLKQGKYSYPLKSDKSEIKAKAASQITKLIKDKMNKI